MRQAEFRSTFRKRGTIQTPLFTWHGSQEEALSLLLQRAISGLESWVVGAAWIELAATGRLAGNIKALRNPGSLKGNGMAVRYFCALPALVYKDAALDHADSALWSQTEAFYREIRNPLMHGHQIDTETVDGVLECFEHLARLFRWTDTWHDWQSGLQHPPKTPPVHLQARRMLLTLPPSTSLAKEDVRFALDEFVRDGRCSFIPDAELASVQTLADLIACATRHQIAPASSV